MLKTILNFVEIRTKLASILPMFTGLFYALTLGYDFKTLNFILFFVSLVFIDMTTTGLNNYFDYKKSILKSGYHYDVHNPIGAGELSLFQSKIILFAFATIAMVFGLVLVYFSHILILCLGIIAFLVAFSYTMGPIPISRTPFGEIFSGIFMGILIPLISGLIYMPMDVIFIVDWTLPWVSLDLNLEVLFQFIVLSLPLFFLIANIMLSNNICDYEEDLVNERKTLPVTIGIRPSLRIFKANYLLAHAGILLGVILKTTPPLVLITLLAMPITFKLLQQFTAAPSKKLTFVNAVKTFFLTAFLYNLALALNLILL